MQATRLRQFRVLSAKTPEGIADALGFGVHTITI